MKSRRHRAIDRSLKEIPMILFLHKKKDKKWLSKNKKQISRNFYIDVLDGWKKGEF